MDLGPVSSQKEKKKQCVQEVFLWMWDMTPVINRHFKLVSIKNFFLLSSSFLRIKRNT